LVFGWENVVAKKSRSDDKALAGSAYGSKSVISLFTDEEGLSGQDFMAMAFCE